MIAELLVASPSIKDWSGCGLVVVIAKKLLANVKKECEIFFDL